MIMICNVVATLGEAVQVAKGVNKPQVYSVQSILGRRWIVIHAPS